MTGSKSSLRFTAAALAMLAFAPPLAHSRQAPAFSVKTL